MLSGWIIRRFHQFTTLNRPILKTINNKAWIRTILISSHSIQTSNKIGSLIFPITQLIPKPLLLRKKIEARTGFEARKCFS